MATLFNEIFSAIRGRCISDESASVAAAEVAELVVKKFTSTNKQSTQCDHDIQHCCDDNEWLCSICGKSARFI